MKKEIEEIKELEAKLPAGDSYSINYLKALTEKEIESLRVSLTEDLIEETFESLCIDSAQGGKLEYSDALEATSKKLNINFADVCMTINGGF